MYNITFQLCKTAGSIHLFMITGRIMTDKVKLKKNPLYMQYFGDRLE